MNPAYAESRISYESLFPTATPQSSLAVTFHRLSTMLIAKLTVRDMKNSVTTIATGATPGTLIRLSRIQSTCW